MRRASDSSDTAETIRDTAETLFSQRGVGAVSLREIARTAGVAVSSVGYHFGDKLGVLRAIYERHTQPMNARRLELLGEAQRVPDPRQRLRAILRAYLLPAFTLAADNAPGGGARFTRLRAVVSADSDPAVRAIISETFDPVSHQFIDALHQCLPTARRTDIVWRVQFMLGAMYTLLTDPTRVDRWSRGEATGSNHEIAIQQLADCFSTSLLALAPPGAEIDINQGRMQ